MVSLELSEDGMSNPLEVSYGKISNGFRNEHAEDILDILKAHPFLQKVKINVQGMSEEKRKEFLNEWVNIWENPSRFKKPSPEELLGS